LLQGKDETFEATERQGIDEDQMEAAGREGAALLDFLTV